MCITFELLHINLYELIKKNKFQGFNLQIVRKFAHSLLQCLDALYKNAIIHCDMKPENILLKQQGRSGIKVIDFGSSCFVNQRVYTYIQSRFYRAPEVILGGKYSMSIDMWSLGCILAELYTGCALLPGEDEADQLACMMELLGMPPQAVLEASKRAKNFINAKGYPRYCTVNTSEDGKVVFCGGLSRRGKPRGPPASRDLKKALKGCNDELFLDFLRRCLEWDQHKRIAASEALKHSWFRRRLPKPPSSSSAVSSSASASVSAAAAAPPISTTTSTTMSVSTNDNNYNSLSYPSLSLTSTLRNEFLNGGSAANKMATLPNKLRVQISATSSDDIAAANSAAAHFTRTLHSSSSLTSLPQSSSGASIVGSSYRPTLNHHHHHHTVAAGTMSGGLSNLNLLQSVTAAAGAGTKLPHIAAQRNNTIT